jgi:phosphotransferase system HPr (HPr) family protein
VPGKGVTVLAGEFTVKFEEGLHARPASDLVRICQVSNSDIRIIKEDMIADPKSILGIMALGAAKGEVLKVEVEGDDEESIYSSLKAFFEEV